MRDDHVIIIGAGPTGLLVALGLGRLGVRVTVIESDKTVNTSPRALTYMPVVLEALNDFGVLEEARKVGHECGRVRWQFQDNGNSFEADVAVLQGVVPFPFNLHMGQDRLAGIILDAIEQCENVGIRWGATLTAIKTSDNGVTVQVGTEAGTETMEGDWLIGADGARSTVRTLSDIDFEGITWPDRYVATNLEFDFHRHKGYGDAIFLIDPVHWALICRVDQGPLWRVTYGESGSISDEEALARVETRLAHFTGTSDFKLVHASPYRVHERAAASFRKGRVLLAGDAAHAVNPLGGQGLTAGILDARELVDTLGGVIEGRYGEEAIDYYAAERRRAVTELSMNFSKSMKRLVQEADPEVRRQDEAFLRQGEDLEVMKQRMFGMTMVRGIPYRDTLPPS
jgi:2-polyprenyl-6-methoxyphenol hydroxylase-like FAD-dependent oxidoreductase